jgi:DNA-binding LytR/AlgR family response regulator
MKVEIMLEPGCSEPRAVIYADRMTDEVADAVKKLSSDAAQLITGFAQDGTAVPLAEDEIIRVFAEQGRVVALTSKGRFTLRQRLYELESRLSGGRFVRISNSEIINLRMAAGFDLSLSGTICVRLSGGGVTYVSRRYVTRIKQVLGV